MLKPERILQFIAVLGLLAGTVGPCVAQDAPLEAFLTAPAFPAQQRPPGDPALIERGSTLFSIQCKGCHGPDLRGGDLGGPNLLRSPIVMSDRAGEAIVPVIQNGRSGSAGGTVMPPLPLSTADAQAVSEYIHAVLSSKQRQGAPPASAARDLTLLVGDATRGARHFAAQCAGCHSVTGDLQGVAVRYRTPEVLQNAWVAGRKPGPPDLTADDSRRRVRVSLAFADGTQLQGRLKRMDDFVVSLQTDAGDYRSFVRRAATPAITAIDVQDPLARHRRLLSMLDDPMMHDLTAYLATLR
jgi:cytochrome c oxidase cbb3-type subunit 3